jgi:hypothetical protein
MLRQRPLVAVAVQFMTAVTHKRMNHQFLLNRIPSRAQRKNLTLLPWARY